MKLKEAVHPDQVLYVGVEAKSRDIPEGISSIIEFARASGADIHIGASSGTWHASIVRKGTPGQVWLWIDGAGGEFHAVHVDSEARRLRDDAEIREAIRMYARIEA